jgi:hypothetical protein
MIRLLLILLAVLTVHACSDSKRDDEARIAALQDAVEAFDAELLETEAQVRALSSDLSEIADAYTDVASRYRDARRRHDDARARADRASTRYQEAAASWEHAASSWRFYRSVLKLAIAIDQARASTRFGKGSYSNSCERVSTASFRRMLIKQGISLAGKDIDHIVPRALGGADHPANYQILDSSLNRSLGKTWNAEKCALAGADRCEEAVAISAKCGSYRGGF